MSPFPPLTLSLDLMRWASTSDVRFHAVSETLAEALASCLPTDLSTDTRKIGSGAIYVPLVGESFDGHTFITQAFASGACVALCNASYFEAHHAELQYHPLLIVEDTLKAFQCIARDWRRACNVTVVGITGSSGKTSTKEIFKQLFAPTDMVHATPANWNNEIGVPKTLLGLTPDHSLCLVEMGMRGEGQIRELCEIAEPDYGVITNIGPVHIGELGSQAAITRAKWELADFVLARDGVRLVVNANNALLEAQYQSLNSQQQSQIARVGSFEGCQLRLLETAAISVQQQCIRFQQAEAAAQSLVLDLPGEHQALNALCGVMLLSVMGKNMADKTDLKVPRLAGRQEEHTLPNGSIVINDAYNANPDSMRAALGVLKQLPQSRVAVLGFMGELGPDSERYHYDLGGYCASLDLQALVVVGKGAEPILEGFSESASEAAAQHSAFFETPEKAVPHVLSILSASPPAYVLVKASRSVQLERLVESVLKERAL